MKPITIPACVLLCATLIAQTPDPNTTFEAAALRPSGPRTADTPSGGGGRGGVVGGPGTASPGRVSYPRFSVQRLLMQAYGVQPDQIQGPDWLGADLFDITANVRKGATAEDVNVMLQNLLIERFKMTLHHATKDGVVYELTVAKGGSKLKDAAAAKGAKHGMESAYSNGTQHKTCRACSIPDLIQGVNGGNTNGAGRIVDKTGLTGKYDFTLEYVAPLMAGAPTKLTALQVQGNAGVDLFGALEKQLGLKLEASKAPVDMLIIDHVERTPTDN